MTTVLCCVCMISRVYVIAAHCSSLSAAKPHMQGERVREMMSETQPAPIRIKLITQLEGTHLDAASAKRLQEQLGPGAVRVVQKFVQVRRGHRVGTAT